MEILSESRNYFIFYFVLALIALVMALSLYFIVKSVTEFMRDGKAISLFFIVFFGMMLSVNIGNSNRLYNLGIPVTYKAVVTDFNEVYKQGYKIVGKEGKLYELKKERDK